MFVLRSTAFQYGDEIPMEHTREGANLSPPLSWSGAPTGTQEFILIFEDANGADSPVPPVTKDPNWLVYRIPATATNIPQGRGNAGHLADGQGAMQGVNSAGTLGYNGPLPPADGEWHHYRFRLIALSLPLKDLRPGMSSYDLKTAMQGKVLESADLMGRCRRQAKSASAA